MAGSAKARRLRSPLRARPGTALGELGFEASYPVFRRIEGEALHLVDIQHWRYGGAFIVNLSRHHGRFVDPEGRAVPLREVRSFDIPFGQRARLQSRPVPATPPDGDATEAGRDDLGFVFDGRPPESWFRFDEPDDDPAAPGPLVASVLERVPETEARFRSGRGPDRVVPIVGTGN